jgi:chromosome segregation ATPase
MSGEEKETTLEERIGALEARFDAAKIWRLNDLEERTERLERRVDELEVPVAGADVATSEVSLAEVSARNVAALLEPVARAVADRHAEAVRGLNMEVGTLRDEVERTARALERATDELRTARGEKAVAERGRYRLERALEIVLADAHPIGEVGDRKRALLERVAREPVDVEDLETSAEEEVDAGFEADLLELRTAAADALRDLERADASSVSDDARDHRRRAATALELALRNLDEPADGTLPGRKPSRYLAALGRIRPLLDLAAAATSSPKRLEAVGTLRTVLADALALGE